MNMWCYLPDSVKTVRPLRLVVVVLLLVALSTTLFLTSIARAAPSTNKTINFQGRLQTSAGAVVADGHYNIQFKIYQDGTGTTVGNPGGSLKWTESHVNNGGANGVEVRNGYFSVNLGSVTPFGTSVDWDQDALFLSMNVAGNSATCTTFGSAPCGADGEMLPMKRITATPYAINAGAVNGKTADNFIQLAQGVQTDASTNTSSIHINKTGTGNLIQLQNAGNNVFSVTNSGDIEFGSGGNRAIYVGGAPENTAGNNLTLFAGYGGSGSGSQGGGLFLQGGSAGGDNGEGGSVAITGGVGTGTGKNGSVYIGASDTDAVQIGSTNLTSGTQTINIGNNNAAGGTTNITIGSGPGATGGTTNIQSKDETSITTNGTRRATFAGDSNTLYVGNADGSGNATTANGFTIQGTSSTGSNTQGGALTVQAGSATNGNANGGNLTLSGGSGSGSGATGLVVINTPTFQTTTNDTNCYTGSALVSSSCTFTSTSVNSSSVLIAGFTTAGQVATLPDPAITTAGRIIYVTAANSSKEFTLRANTGAGIGVEQNVTLRQNTTATMIWNGSDWTVAGGSNSTTLQNTYDNTPQNAGSADIVLGGGSGNDGLTIRDNSTTPVSGPLLEVQGSNTTSLFSVNSDVNELASNPGAETAGATSTTFPANTWDVSGAATVTRHTTAGNYIASGQASTKVVATGEISGATNTLKSALIPGKTYTVSMSLRLESGPGNGFGIIYAADGVTPTENCVIDVTLSTSEWKKVSCSFQAPASGITSQNAIAIGKTSEAAQTFYVDNVSVKLGGSDSTGATGNVQVGGGANGGSPTLFTLDKNSSAPTGSNHDALLGSMYYDTTLGKVQCYESEGWGACGASPDNFITISPEYSGAVMHGDGIGAITTDICSDSLNINDGSSAQPTICGSNETYNFYKWTTPETSTQSRAIFVTYQLPATFKDFIPGSTSLMGRTNSSDSAVTYQIYRNNSSTGLTACGSIVSVSTGSQSTWQKAGATGSADPSTCGFAAGDSIVIRVNLNASNNANAYASNLNFTFSNH